MITTEKEVQTMVHALEEGAWRKWVWFSALFAACAGMYWYMVVSGSYFKGLSDPQAMDQAQIARELARGQGFSTKLIRPVAMWQFVKNKGFFPLNRTPDTYQAPLPVILDSILLRATKSHWRMTKKDYVYVNDRMIAGAETLFFYLAVLLNYFIAKRLFDRRLALIGMGLLLLCDTFWKFSLSGLPQMLMLLIFSGCTYTLMRGIDASYAGKRTIWWSALTGLLFGILALVHGMGFWVLLGAAVFSAIFFRPRGRDALIMAGVCLLIYSPWMLRNYRACGSAFGIAPYSGLYGLKGTVSSIMRSMELDVDGITPATFRTKMQNETAQQLGLIYEYLGSIVVAPVFFLSLLNTFKRSATNTLKWAVFCMWLFALLGMSVIGLPASDVIQANNLHVLFIPMATFYGLAFVLVLWSRFQINVLLVRIGFITLLFLISVLPFANSVLVHPGLPVHWPPYVPPYIAILGDWTNPSEIIGSDMPWAVAWYADRKSLWIPELVDDFINLNDYNRLGGSLVGLYLTPESGDKEFFADIIKGEYKDWAPLIERSVNSKDFPLRAVTAMPIDNQCVFYSDRDRWSEKPD